MKSPRLPSLTRHGFSSLVRTLILVAAGAAPLLAQDAASTTGTTSASTSSSNTSTPPPATSSPGLLTPPPDTSSSSSATSNTSPAPAATATSNLTPSSAPATITPPPAPSPAPASTPAPPSSATSTSTPMTRAEINRIQQQEVIRRQQITYQANESLSAARKAELAQDYPEARKDYLYCVEAYGPISRASSVYAKSAEGLTRVDFQLYDAALTRGDTKQAKQLIEEVVYYNPNNQEANAKLLQINRALANPSDTSILGNPAVTPGFVNNVNQVQELFALAEQYRRTGQWDLAEDTLKKILGIDPYNKTASKALEQIHAEKYDYAEHARLETREERLRQVEEAWAEPVINNETILNNNPAGEPVLKASTTFNLDQKLKSIFLSLDFDGATIEQATNFLSVRSKDLDPDKKGINFIIEPAASESAKPITLTLNNVPLGEALRYICQLAGVKYKVQDYAISIVPFSAPNEDLISRTFIVQPSFVTPPSAAPTDTSGGAFGGGAATRPLAPTTPEASTNPAGEDTVRAALEAKGIKFAPGASAVYTPTTSQLTVVDTADQMELIEELVNAGQAPTLMVRVATKFVEINQDDLNDLTINTAVGFNDIGFVTSLPGARALAPDSIDFLIQPTAQNFNTLAVRGFIDHVAYEMVFDALAQKRSFDLLSEPSVLTKSGEQGSIEAVRVFPYPIAFDPPQLVTPTTTGLVTSVSVNPPTIVPSTPTDFKRRNIGVRLVVKPQIVADNKTIDLSLFPEVTDFDGFINYGSPIFVVNPTTYESVPGYVVPPGLVGEPTGLDPTSLLTPNDINQPVFETRRINTKVLIHDGSTVILGGLMRDDLETVNDKVPLLGDLPLVGRLFQSKAVQDNKRNLIIFVTASIYRNDGELLNPPEEVNAADILTGRASIAPTATP